jgi:hypothetical protein
VFGGLRKKLFGPKKSDLHREIEALVSQVDFADPQARIGWKISEVIGAQLLLLELKTEQVCATGEFATPNFRGAILGTALGLAEVEGVREDHELLLDTILYSFIYVYGDQNGRLLAGATTEQYRAGDDKVMSASNWAEKDLVLALTKPSGASVSGIYLAGMGMI